MNDNDELLIREGCIHTHVYLQRRAAARNRPIPSPISRDERLERSAEFVLTTYCLRNWCTYDTEQTGQIKKCTFGDRQTAAPPPFLRKRPKTKTPDITFQDISHASTSFFWTFGPYKYIFIWPVAEVNNVLKYWRANRKAVMTISIRSVHVWISQRVDDFNNLYTGRNVYGYSSCFDTVREIHTSS